MAEMFQVCKSRRLKAVLTNRKVQITLLLSCVLLMVSKRATISSSEYRKLRIADDTNHKKEYSDRVNYHLLHSKDTLLDAEYAENHNFSAPEIVAKYKPMDPSLVIYNRLPKCASTMMRTIIEKLTSRNHFHYINDNWPKVKQSLVLKDEISLGERVSWFPQHSIFLRHLYFVDFKHYAPQHSVTFINVIRNPVDRFVSHYYFSRFGMNGWSQEKIIKWLGTMSDERRHMSLDECLKRNATKCIAENRETMIEFFCGMDRKCRLHDRWAIEKAKANIIKNYLFIGLTEQLEITIKVFEKILPRYFSEASKEYKYMESKASSTTRTANKISPTKESKRILQDKLWGEMEIYNFVLKTFWYK